MYIAVIGSPDFGVGPHVRATSKSLIQEHVNLRASLSSTTGQLLLSQPLLRCLQPTGRMVRGSSAIHWWLASSGGLGTPGCQVKHPIIHTGGSLLW